MDQDTIENVSWPKFFLNVFKKKKIFFLTSFYAKNVFTIYNVFFGFFLPMKTWKKLASKVAELAQIQPKFQLLFHKNLPQQGLLYNNFEPGIFFITRGFYYYSNACIVYVPNWEFCPKYLSNWLNPFIQHFKKVAILTENC